MSRARTLEACHRSAVADLLAAMWSRPTLTNTPI